MSDNLVKLPSAKPVEVDVIEQALIARLEAYVEGSLMSDTQKREAIAAYMSGMVGALDLLSPKKGQQHILLPAVLQKKVLNFAAKMGMQFEEKK